MVKTEDLLRIREYINDDLDEFWLAKLIKMSEEDDEKSEKEKKELKRLKGYGYDSLALRYQKARYDLAQYQSKDDMRAGKDPERAFKRAERDFMRFIQILNDIIGEHD